MEQGANRLLWDHNISPSIIDGCFPWFPVIGGLILPAPEPRDPVIPFPPTFPGNLLHNIFTHLMPNGDNQHDCRDLMNCSLTSRKWHVYAQRILLQHPVVRNPSWLRLLSRARWKLRMKRSPSLNVNLMLKGPPCGKPHLIQAWKSNVDWQEQACYVLSPYVAKTSTLRLDNLQFIRWETFSSKVHRTSINLQKLSLNFCRFSTFEEFEGLIRSFKSLNSLSLDFVSWNSAPPFRRRSCRNVVKLVPRCLRIGRNCDIHTLVDWILETQYWQQLERLEIDEISSSIGERVLEAVSSLQLLSSLAERQLRYLKLGCRFEISPWHEDTWPSEHYSYHLLALRSQLCLYRMPNLDTLHIRLLDLARINLKWVPDFLATALHPEINAKAFGPTTIIFDVWLHNIHQLKDSLWNDIAGALSHLITCGKRLHCIEFVQRGPLEVPLVEFIVREALAGPEFLVSKLAFSRGITE